MEKIIIYEHGDSRFSQIWLHQRRITIFEAKARFTRDLVEAWGKTVIATVEAWPQTKRTTLSTTTTTHKPKMPSRLWCANR